MGSFWKHARSRINFTCLLCQTETVTETTPSIQAQRKSLGCPERSTQAGQGFALTHRKAGFRIVYRMSIRSVNPSPFHPKRSKSISSSSSSSSTTAFLYAKPRCLAAPEFASAPLHMLWSSNKASVLAAHSAANPNRSC